MTKVFISYQRASARIAQRLRRDLEQEGFEVWLDTEQIRHTQQWSWTIDQALRTADRLVLLLTEAANTSPEVFNEWFYFYQHHRPLHVVRLDSCDPHYQLLPFQRLEWGPGAPHPWEARVSTLVRELRAPFTWPHGDPGSSAVVTSPFAPTRSLPGALVALETAIRRPDRPVAISGEQLAEIRAHKSRNLREYLLACYARWCAPQYQLDRRFVRLTLVADQDPEAADRWASYPGTRSSNDLREVLTHSTAFAHVLLGTPGSGKSTVLRRLEMDLAVEGLTRPDSEHSVPFSVSLAEYGLGTGARTPSPLSWLEQRWATRCPELPPLGDFLARGRVLLLLDGLNEMPHADAADLRRRVDAWRGFLYEHIRDVPGNQAVFACRTLDYGAMLSSATIGVPHIRLEPMSRRQVFEYLRLYLPQDQADLVRETLLSNPQSLSLYRTPYMLTLLLQQVRTVGTVPVGRADTFAGMIREVLRREIFAGNPRVTGTELLTDREQRRLRDGVTDPLWLPDRGRFIPALTRLAYQMQHSRGRTDHSMDRGTVAVDYDTALDLLDSLIQLAETSLRAGCDTGLLEEEQDAVRFFHQLLQEFFAARQFAAAPDFERVTVAVDADAVQPPLEQVIEQLAPGEPLPPPASTGWEETAVMAAALSRDPDTYVRALMAFNPAAAGRCLAAADIRLTDATQAEVAHMLADRIEDPGVDLRVRLQLGRLLGTTAHDPRYERCQSPHGSALVPRFARIPEGRYRIGAVNPDYPLEAPVHPVDLDAFELALWPVTNAEYARFIDAGGYQDPRWWHGAAAQAWRDGRGTLDLIAREWLRKRDSLRRRPNLPVQMLRSSAATLQHAVSMVKLAEMSDEELHEALARIHGSGAPAVPAYWHDSRLAHPAHPVVGVSVYEAEAYCAWLSAVTGTRIRLPSEYEWETAASGSCTGTVPPDGSSRGTQAFPYGDAFDPYAGNTFELHLRTTAPVGVFPGGVSAQGCYDLSGNVFEWTASPAGPYPQAADAALRVDEAPDAVRICRGGSWRHHHIRARAAYRGRGQVFVRNDDLGFRIARS